MIHTLLLAGGSGTRFWPLSRQRQPKQFLSIIDEDPMIIKTIKRLEGLVDPKNFWLLGNQEQQDCLPLIKDFIPSKQVLAEPFAKNTAACIGWGIMEVLQKDPDATVIILPADAWIEDAEAFQLCIKDAIEVAANSDTVVTLGIKPKFAHTGFGYIKVSATDSFPLSVDSFKEKPDLKTAESYLKDSSYFWNAGMFIAKARFLASLYEDYMPNHYKILKKLLSKRENDDDFNKLYKKFESISIDYGIMEKISSSIKLVPARFSWNDIGNWSALVDYLKKDINNNAANCDVLSLNARNNLVYSKQKKLVSLANVNDLIIVDTDDAILVLPKKDDQMIKKIYEQLGEEYK